MCFSSKSFFEVPICFISYVLTRCRISYSALQELKWLRLLSNVEGTVKLLDAFVHEQQVVLVFNYADCDLTGICVKGPKLQLAEVKCLMRQILEAVYNIHSRLLMHRDIKGMFLNEDSILRKCKRFLILL